MLGYMNWWIWVRQRRLLSQSRAWHSFLCLPPPLSQMSDFVFLAICSHCAALPDRRHSGRLGSVNCKGMWHSFLKLRMFLWIFWEPISGPFPCGVWRKCFRIDTQVNNKSAYSRLYPWLTATDCWAPNTVFIWTANTPVRIVIVLLSTFINIKYLGVRVNK